MARPIIPAALRFLGIGRRRLREVFEWAEENPAAAASGCRAFAGFCDHRIRLLSRRRWALRKAHRIARLKSAIVELDELAAMYDRKVIEAPTEPIMIEG